jgi:hypothetical protein
VQVGDALARVDLGQSEGSEGREKWTNKARIRCRERGGDERLEEYTECDTKSRTKNTHRVSHV